jgi:hypothetical protein
MKVEKYDQSPMKKPPSSILDAISTWFKFNDRGIDISVLLLQLIKRQSIDE